jgi:hypothetical protein
LNLHGILLLLNFLAAVRFGLESAVMASRRWMKVAGGGRLIDNTKEAALSLGCPIFTDGTL